MDVINNEILQEISYKELPELREIYKNVMPHATHIYSFINTAIKWKIKKPEQNYIVFYGPHDWRIDGTFIALLTFSCYDLMVFTLDKSGERIYKALNETKKIDFKNNHVLFYALHKDHRDAVLRFLNDNKIPLLYETKTDYWWIPKEKAVQFEIDDCPEDFYVENLKSEHASIINEVWPFKYEGSLEYLKTFIEFNGGHGVFTKNDNKLVSWVLKTQMGTLGQLQTLEEYKRKGLGAVITKSVSKEVGMEGHNPLGTVLQNNTASQKLFKKLGFEIFDWCSFIGAGKEVHKDFFS